MMMATEETKSITVAEFTEIPVALPPILMKMIGYPASARFVCLYYMGTCATWNDGRGLATFSYYRVYEPLKEHPAIALYLFDADLGSDDSFPTHALVCDRQERKLFVGDYEKAIRFVRQQHAGTPVDEMVVAEYKREIDDPVTAAGFNRLGMFEIFTAPDAAAQRETELLRQWLDGYITEELINRLLAMVDEKDLRAYLPLSYIKHLIEAAQSNATTATEIAPDGKV